MIRVIVAQTGKQAVYPLLSFAVYAAASKQKNDRKLTIFLTNGKLNRQFPFTVLGFDRRWTKFNVKARNWTHPALYSVSNAGRT
jgi:hypothetical protein